ncbi:MAG: homoaconitate hydratase [Candidatus Methanomethylophilaceae archaeon]
MKSKNEVNEILNRPLCICDSTLLDGEKAAGVVFSNIEKYRIAQLLDEAGVPQIVAGNPSLGAEEKMAVRHIARMGLGASVMSWNRADINDINRSIECDVDAVCISMPSSDNLIQNKLGKDHAWVADKVYEAASYATEHGLYVSVIAEDTPNANLAFLIDFAKAAVDAGADRVGYQDIIGKEDPFTCYERIKTLRQIMPVDIEIITRNDFGMATANTIAALKAGARFANVSSMGIGERAGCAPLEEVALAARHILNMEAGVDGTKFREIADAVSLATGRAISPSKPIIGSSVFVQESGISVDGIIRDENGEAFDPAEVGCQRSVVIGKHSGRNTIVSEMAQMGIEIDRNAASELLDMVRKASTQMHRSISQKELFLLYEDLMNGNDIFDENDEPSVPEVPMEPVGEAPAEQPQN